MQREVVSLKRYSKLIFKSSNYAKSKHLLRALWVTTTEVATVNVSVNVSVFVSTLLVVTVDTATDFVCVMNAVETAVVG